MEPPKLFSGNSDHEVLFSFEKKLPTICHVPSYGKCPLKARNGSTMVSCGDKIFIFGGTSEDKRHNDTFFYYPKTQTWELIDLVEGLDEIPAPRSCAPGVYSMKYNAVFMFGGTSSSRTTPFSDFCIFDLESRKWQIIEDEEFPSLQGHSMCICRDEVYVLGGSVAAPRNRIQFLDEFLKFTILKEIFPFTVMIREVEVDKASVYSPKAVISPTLEANDKLGMLVFVGGYDGVRMNVATMTYR
eukprot:TRINITY_DN7283_c0_g1_i1.p1 TRINITY_DN7283_c0_g1~~TRINITY_DN7283_c0_g1_i1.p1  ORF type:complete len:243 (-),score=45.80 TRINITY_DN7283_c0_g1_i1:37-765(-)